MESLGEILNTNRQTPTQSFCECGNPRTKLVFGDKVIFSRACPECETKRWHIEKFQRIRQKRSELAKQLNEKLDRILPPRYRSARLCHLSPKLVALMLNTARDKGVMLSGPAGVGKTYAMAALVRKLAVAGRHITRITYDNLCLQIRDAYKQSSCVSEKTIISRYQNADILLIEDLGTTVGGGSQESDFSLRTLLTILDYRLEYLKPIYITTNKTVDELAQSFDSRVASRLHQACEIVPVTGKDRRKAKHGRPAGTDSHILEAV